MQLATLLQGLPGITVEGPLDVDVTQVHHDSRALVPGGLYIALPGRFYAGVRYLADALGRGAAVLAVPADTDAAAIPAGATVLRLDHPRKAMAALAARIHGRPSRRLSLVGVTGTNGKTTVTTLVADMAAAAGLPDGLIGTNGIRIAGQRRAAQLTTPEATDLQALLAEMVAAQVPVAAMEVSSIGLAEDRCEALEFAAVAFLNLTVDHLDYHGDMAAYGEAKRRLFTDLLAPGAIAVINVEDAFGRALADSLTHPLIWRLSLEDPTADVHIRALTLDAAGCRGVLVTPRGELPFDCPLPGRYNAENVATAGALAFAVDLPTGAIARALHRAAIAGRMQTVTNPHGLLTVVDYAHSDDALLRAIEALRPLTRGRLWCVFGCGGDRDATKRGPMGRAAATADAVVITNDNPRSEDPAAIAAAALAGAEAAGRPLAERPAPGHSWVCLDRRAAIFGTLAAAAPGDTVLIAGKGHENHQEIQGVRHPFDDVAVAREALSRLGERR
ncbi:MAG: UDP-N-acetylmuramoyl-L-alanyl-D-glutamate--2,6-diaminopimelate ligase [Myxococcales bacterium]|nr:UDP-N-acetylmuramoyl-L-alanyl-D-glutamate--2,6-diaminopimelate ligase [Myxococcales bacterium]